MTKQTRVFMAAVGLAAMLAIPAAASAQAARTLTVQLSQQGGSGVIGTATLTEMAGGMTEVVVRVSTGGNAAMPAHFHDGTCATLNPTPKIPLNSVANGTSTSMVPGTVASLLATPLAINLHKSAAEASVYTACGNVVAGAAALPSTGAGPAGVALPAILAGAVSLAGAALVAIRRRS